MFQWFDQLVQRFDQLPSWLQWGGGVLGSVAIFLVLQRFIGWKWAASLAGILGSIVAAGKRALSLARADGARQNEVEQQRRNEELRRRLDRAAEEEVERLRQTGDNIDEQDPYLRD